MELHFVCLTYFSMKTPGVPEWEGDYARVDFCRILTDTCFGGSAAGRLLVGGSKSIASFFMRGGKSRSTRGIRIWDVHYSPTLEDMPLFLSFPSKLQLIEPGAEFIANLITFWRIHSL